MVLRMTADFDFRLDLTHRPRRLRRTAALRAMANETDLHVHNLIQPLFVIDGDGASEAIESMPGISRLTIPLLVQECRELADLGIPAVALFPKLDDSLKTDDGREALNPGTLVLRAIRTIKNEVPEMVVITDLALDPYTVHGHDGLFDVQAGDLINDATVEILAEMAVLAAEAGADFVAPSDMMDGRVGVIREALDKASYTETSIMSYTAKYASSFYGPFRDALKSAPKSGDKKTYQMNPANKKEALIEAQLDIEEGADMIMVKPAICYLDVIHLLKENFSTPVTAYNVSGEYAMIHAAAQKGWLNYDSAMCEMLLSIRRAGADGILTYFAKDFAKLMQE